MAWELKFFDDFDNSTVDIQTDPANGAVAEPAGSDLVVSITAGQHAGWASGIGNDNKGFPLAFEDVADHVEHKGLLRFETRLTDLTKTGNEIFAGLTVFTRRTEAFLIGWYDGNDDIYVYKVVDDSNRTGVWQVGNYGNPSTTDHIYRFYANLTAERVVLPEGAWVLDPGTGAFVFSHNAGSSWVFTTQLDLTIGPSKCGLYALNWGSSWRGVDASFDYLKIEQDLHPQFSTDHENSTSRQDARQPKQLIEDKAEVGDAGGPPAAIGKGMGQYLPSPLALATGTPSPTQRQPRQLVEDGAQWQFEAGPQEERGLFREGQHGLKGLLEGDAKAKIATADYMQEKDDSDGAEFISGSDIVVVARIDTTVGGFGNPTTNNHYGAARDGKYYVDGVEATTGGYSFGTLAGGFNLTDWSMSGQDPMGLSSGATVFALTADDELRIQGTWAAWANPGGDVSSKTRWVILAGDFDIQVDFSNYVVNAGSEGASRLAVTAHRAEGDNQFYINRDANGTYRTARILDGGYASLGTTGTSDTSGKLRITRVSGVLTAYKWNGSSWDSVGSTLNDSRLQGAVQVGLGSSGNNNTNTDIRFSNFTVNSGTVSNLASWARESSGDHRGTQASMPNTLGVVCTPTSVNLIDLDNNKLWMRFVRSGSNALHYYSSYGQRPRDIAWSDGVLCIAHGSREDQSEEGGAIIVDFTWDHIRIHRQAASTVCGGYYNGRSSVETISVRNDDKSYKIDDDDWQIPDYRVFSVDIWHSGGYEFRAVGNVDGVSMFKEQRWYYLNTPDVERSNSTETVTVRQVLIDSTSGELFYVDDSDVRSVAKTGIGGWETVMSGGTFTAQTTKSLPGSRHTLLQHRIVRYGSYLFIPAWEGVYRVDWPSGSWTLFYGKDGSGATHEILTDYSMILSIELGNDGTYDLLVVGMKNHAWGGGQVAGIKLSDNTIYGVSPVVELEEPRAIGA